MERKVTSFFVIKKQIKTLLLICLACSFYVVLSRAAWSDAGMFAGHFDEIIVKYKGRDLLEKVEVPTGVDVARVIGELSEDPRIEYAEPNFIYQAAIIPSDTFFYNQWYLKKIKAPEAWDIVRESPGVTIAIIDSGVDINHPDLKDNIWTNSREIAGNGIDDDGNGYIDDVNGWDFVNNSADPLPKFKPGFTQDGVLHGTIVAGVAAGYGNNGIGISGVTWQAKIMPLKVLDDKGSGDTMDVIKAVNYAVANGADIINFSFVGFGNSQSLADAIARAYNSGKIIVAAAGNDQGEGNGLDLDKAPIYPACHDGGGNNNFVIGVSATDTLDQKAEFSGFGFKCVDITAPGVSIYSTSIFSPENANDEYGYDRYYDGYWAGTSMAAPIISSVIALIVTANPALDQEGARQYLFNNADNINKLNPDYLGRLGAGRVNVYRAVNAARQKLASQKVSLLLAPNTGDTAEINVTDIRGNFQSKFDAYAKDFRGGVNVTAGDVDGDGQEEIITGAGQGGGPHVRIFDASGQLKGQFFAYGKDFRGGVNVTAGDVDGDGQEEIITGAGQGGGPHVRIFDASGQLKGQFFAYGKDFRGGVNVTAGDVDGDGQEEIITGAGQGGGPQVRIFSPNGQVEGQFFAYEKNFRGGVRVASGKLVFSGSGKKESIVTAPGSGGGPHIRIFDNHAVVIKQFFSYDQKFRGGVNIAVSDVDQDGLDEIVTGAGPGGSPHVRVFENNGSLLSAFFGFKEDFTGGVNVGALRVSSEI